MVQFATLREPRHITPNEKNINDVVMELYRRVQQLSNTADAHEIVTSNPSGSLRRQAGTIVLFNDGGTFRWFVNTDDLTTWQENTV